LAAAGKAKVDGLEGRCHSPDVPTTVTYPHIEKPPGEAARVARLPRIRVSQIVLPHLMHGWSAEELGRQYPHLTMAEIHAALGYYFDHTEEISRLLRQPGSLTTGEWLSSVTVRYG